MVESSGVPYWVFWLMLVFILFLATVILTRDKGIREGIKNIFRRARKKIHEAKIKLKINKEKEKTAVLLKELGEKIWEKEIEISGASDIKEKLKNLQPKEETSTQSLETIEKEIKENKQAHDRFKAKQDAAMKEQEGLKAPETEALNRLKKELSEIEKSTGEKARLKSKDEKKVTAYKKKIAEIQDDDDLSKIEKKMKSEELERDINGLNREIDQLTRELAPLYEKKGNPGKEIRRIKPKIVKYEEEIKRLKEEQKSRHKENDTKNREQLKTKGDLLGKKNQLKRQKEALFGKLGKTADSHRVENNELAGLYSQIDRVEKTIKELERQMRSNI